MPTFVVTSTADTDDGACNTANCTLREALKAANAQAGDDVIGFAAGVSGTIILSTALPAISSNIQIIGPGADNLTVQRSGAAGTPNFDVLRITSVTVVISGLTISGGSTETQGGGINNIGTLTLNGCAVTGNKGARFGGVGIYNGRRMTVNDSIISGNSNNLGSARGGGIYNDGFLAVATVINSTIANNTAQGGGGIFNNGTFTLIGSTVSGNRDLGTDGGGIQNQGSFTITNSTVSGNTSGNGDGAGIANSGSCVVVNSTISGNSTNGWGGGINNRSSLSISNSTVTNNSADVAGGLFSGGTPINIVNTIVAGNRVRSELPDVHGSYASQGYNLIGNIGTFAQGFPGVGDLVGTPTAPHRPEARRARLERRLAQTHALLAGSPAIDQGGCSKATPADQRGLFRYDFADVSNVDGGCDIGSFEAQPPPAVSINSATVTEGNTGTTDMTFTVSLQRPAALAVSVNYATEDFTATAGADYLAAQGTLTFAAGATTQTFNVQIVGDALNEFNDAFLVRLSSPQGAGIGEAVGAGIIIDNDPAPSLSIGDARVAEGNAGLTAAVFDVSLSAISGKTVTVDFATAPGTASAGADYGNASGTIVFLPGVTQQTVVVPIFGDATPESDETFSIALSMALNASVVRAQGQGTIVNDDAAATPTRLQLHHRHRRQLQRRLRLPHTDANSTPPTPTPLRHRRQRHSNAPPEHSVFKFGMPVFMTTEGAGQVEITVARLGDPSGEADVDYSTRGVTASERSDFTIAAGRLHFAPFETAKSFPVLVTEDSHVEGQEFAQIILDDPATGATVDLAQLIIQDDAEEPTVNASDVPALFVRQHYHDFLGRNADAPGLAFWVGEFNRCQNISDPQESARCNDDVRVNVSAAFFLSIEFQQTGFLVYRMYRASLPRKRPASARSAALRRVHARLAADQPRRHRREQWLAGATRTE